MEISFNKAELEKLVEIAVMADWVMTAHDTEDDERKDEYLKLIQKIFGFAWKNGMKKEIEHLEDVYQGKDEYFREQGKIHENDEIADRAAVSGKLRRHVHERGRYHDRERLVEKQENPPVGDFVIEEGGFFPQQRQREDIDHGDDQWNDKAEGERFRLLPADLPEERPRIKEREKKEIGPAQRLEFIDYHGRHLYSIR